MYTTIMESAPKRPSPLWFWGPDSITVVYVEILGIYTVYLLVFRTAGLVYVPQNIASLGLPSGLGFRGVIYSPSCRPAMLQNYSALS